MPKTEATCASKAATHEAFNFNNKKVSNMKNKTLPPNVHSAKIRYSNMQKSPLYRRLNAAAPKRSKDFGIRRQ